MSDMPVRVKVQDSASQVIYTDAVLINGNPLGFVLNFGQIGRASCRERV